MTFKTQQIHPIFLQNITVKQKLVIITKNPQKKFSQFFMLPIEKNPKKC